MVSELRFTTFIHDYNTIFILKLQEGKLISMTFGTFKIDKNVHLRGSFLKIYIFQQQSYIANVIVLP